MSEVLKGIGVVSGTAVGTIKIAAEDLTGYLSHYQEEAPEREAGKFMTALQEAYRQVQTIIASASKQGAAEQAAIMETHLAMLEDPSLKEAVLQKIKNAQAAPGAVLEATQEYAAVFAAMDDKYLRERAADILDIGRRVARVLLGVRDFDLGSGPAIVCAVDIEPSALAALPADSVRGLVLEHGSTTSHVVIIAKARGIVTVVGVSGVNRLKEGAQAVVDGTSGKLVIEPDQAELEAYISRLEEERKQHLLDMAKASLPSVTTDGVLVQLAANIGSPRDMEQALKAGAEGVGLYRTEFLFMERSSLPSEEEQFQAYREVAEQCGRHLCIIRTLDIGGDKPLPYLDIGQEANPFLGWRAIRICLDRPALFITQLKAILRAGAYGNVAIMLPMVISAQEIRQAKAYLAQAANELAHEGKEFARKVQLGIMVETPAAAVTAVQLAKECDFFSIGTNDLTQYTLAVDRGNQKVRKLYNHFHPAVLRLIEQVVRAARGQGIWVGMCGEMAGDSLAAVLLTGMGINELSMSADVMPRVRERIRSIAIPQAQQLLQQALQYDDGDAVREFLAGALKDI